MIAAVIEDDIMKIGPLTLFKGMSCNGEPTSGFLIAAWHWPSSITWSWMLVWYPHGDTLIGRYRFDRHVGWNTRRFGDWSFQSQRPVWRRDVGMKRK